MNDYPYYDPTEPYYVVVCRNDRLSARKPGPYVLATRKVFTVEADAKAYAKTVAKSRQPLVIGGRFHQLRFPSPADTPETVAEKARIARVVTQMLFGEEKS
jgi:hypothetical protein